MYSIKNLHQSIQILFLFSIVSFELYAQDQEHYQKNSVLSESIIISDRKGDEIQLRQLIENSGKELSVIFIFGGGGMGHERANKNGGLWCPDSFEDLHILRSLHNHYEGTVQIIPVAVPPVFHSGLLGYEDRVFFKGRGRDDYQAARASFIDSTQLAFSRGTIPVQPFYDHGFNLLISPVEKKLRSGSIPIKDWHGAFRAENETQHYGVPNMWLVDSSGEVLESPFRGNIYRAHGGDIQINYTLKDVIDVIDRRLQASKVH